MTPLYIVETIHTCDGENIVTRYPTLFLPDEAMDERTIQIFAGLKKPFERYAGVDYVLYYLEDQPAAGQWRITRRHHVTAATWIAAPQAAGITAPASTVPENTTYCPVPR